MSLYRITAAAILGFTAFTLAAKDKVEPPLRYRFEPGTTQTYRLRKIMDITTIGTPNPVNPIHIEPEFSLTLKTAEMKPDGNAVMEIVVSSWVEPGSKTQSGMTSPRYRCTISPLGVINDLALADKNDPAATVTITGSTAPYEWGRSIIQEMLLYLFPLWPEKLPSDGKSWEAGRTEMVSTFGTISYRQTAQIAEQSQELTILAIHIESPKATTNSTVMRNKSISSPQGFVEHPPGSTGWDPVNFTSTMSMTGDGKAIYFPAEGRVLRVDLQETQIVFPDLSALLSEVESPEARQAIKEKKAHQEIKTHVTIEWVATAAKTK